MTPSVTHNVIIIKVIYRYELFDHSLETQQSLYSDPSVVSVTVRAALFKCNIKVHRQFEFIVILKK